jgi:hypothetical protein
MPEQSHQALQGDAGVDQSGGIGVTQLMRGGMRQAGIAGNAGHDVAKVVDGQAPTVVSEQEIGGSCGARMWQRSPG